MSTTSLQLARKCLDAAEPLLAMIVDDDPQHTGQLRYPKKYKNVGEALKALTALLKKVNSACGTLKKSLSGLPRSDQRIARETDEGILIDMILKAILALSDEVQRLKTLSSAAQLEQSFFPQPTNKTVLAIRKLIARRAGEEVSLSASASLPFPMNFSDGNAAEISGGTASEASISEAVQSQSVSVSDKSVTKSLMDSAQASPTTVSVSESAIAVAQKDKQSIKPKSASVSETVLSVSTADDQSDEPKEISVAETTVDVPQADKPGNIKLSETVVTKSEGGDEKQMRSVSVDDEQSDDDSLVDAAADALLSLSDEASAILSDFVEQQPPKTPAGDDFATMMIADLRKAFSSMKTHAEKDTFIGQLLDRLEFGSADSTAEKRQQLSEENLDDKDVANDAAGYVVEDVSPFVKSIDKVKHVLVKWKGYPPEENTWEPRTKELTRAAVKGDFYKSTDTSYKKFCERIGKMDESSAKRSANRKAKACAAIDKAHKERQHSKGRKKKVEQRRQEESTDVTNEPAADTGDASADQASLDAERQTQEDDQSVEAVSEVSVAEISAEADMDEDEQSLDEVSVVEISAEPDAHEDGETVADVSEVPATEMSAEPDSGQDEQQSVAGVSEVSVAEISAEPDDTEQDEQSVAGVSEVSVAEISAEPDAEQDEQSMVADSEESVQIVEPNDGNTEFADIPTPIMSEDDASVRSQRATVESVSQ